MTDRQPGGLEDDVRPRMFALAGAGRAFALATIVAADGGPRPVGSQMVVDADQWWGFLSGGCIEADVALHGREVVADGAPCRLVYGQGSPFIDMRLPCGGRLDVLVERIAPGEPALAALAELTAARRPARWVSDGVHRRCAADDGAVDPGGVNVPYIPGQRLLVVGSDPYAIAIAEQGRLMGWEVVLVAPHGPEAAPPIDVVYQTASAGRSLAELRPDCWTAIAVATHDVEADHEALVAALGTEAGYVGVLGARRRLPQRLAALRAAGVSEAALGRLKAPIGLPLRAANAREVAVAVIAEIVAIRHDATLT